MATNKFQKRIMKLKGFWNLLYLAKFFHLD